jgi:orotate phosphoribosyltransferase
MNAAKIISEQQETIQRIQKTIGAQLAEQAFSMGAIRLQTANPFQWASGYRMPIYNDNRQLLQSPSVRFLIAQGFSELIGALNWKPQYVAGTATAGIPHATTLSDLIRLPLSYVRSSSKEHGLKNRIEGLGPDGNYNGAEVVLIEDLISTGGSSIDAVKAIRSAGGDVPCCLAIFTYGLKAAEENFRQLNPACVPITILTYDIMIEAAQLSGYIDSQAADSLAEWRVDPFGWGENHGFPRVEG